MVTEVLLQSHRGVIKVFPGWPAGKPGAQFSGLVAEGCVYVSSRMEAGRVQFVQLRRGDGAAMPGEGWGVRLRSPWTGEIEERVLGPGQVLVLTELGEVDGAPRLAPAAPEEAGPRVFWRDAHSRLWLGRSASGDG